MTHILFVMLSSLIGGAVGFGIWLLTRKYLFSSISEDNQQKLQWVIVGVCAFLGALSLPNPFNDSGARHTNEQYASSNNSADINSPIVFEDRPFPLDHVLLSVLAKLNPAFETQIITHFNNQNATSDQINEFALTRGVEEAIQYVPRAQDEQLVNLIEVLALTTQTLLSKNPHACYSWHYGAYGYGSFDYQKWSTAVGSRLIDLQFDLYVLMIDSANKSEGTQTIEYDPAIGDAAISRVNFAMIQSAGFENNGLISGDRPPKSLADYEIACIARLTLYQALLAEDQPGIAIRHLFLQGQ